MNRDLPSLASRRFPRNTRVLMPSFVQELVRAIRKMAPRERGNRVDDLEEPRHRFGGLVGRLLQYLLSFVRLVDGIVL